MTYPSFSNNPSGDAIYVQLHYDHLSGTAHAWSTVFDGVLPSRCYPTREAAADAARTVIATIISKDDATAPRRDIRIWLR